MIIMGLVWACLYEQGSHALAETNHGLHFSHGLGFISILYNVK